MSKLWALSTGFPRQGDHCLFWLKVDLAEADDLAARFGDRDLLDCEVKGFCARGNGLIKGLAHPDHVFTGKAHFSGQRINQPVFKPLSARGVIVEHPRRVYRVSGSNGQLTRADQMRVLQRPFVCDGR